MPTAGVRASRAALGLALGLLVGPVLALTGAVGGAPAAADTQPGPDGAATTWSVVPATADGPDGRTSIRQTVDPGTQVVEHVTVSNLGAAPATFRVYASDGVVTDAGAFDLLPPGVTPTGGGAWVGLVAAGGEPEEAVAEQVVELDASSSVTLPVVLDVPEDAVPGDHPAGVVAELVQGGASTVQMTTRVGLRLHLQVSGDLVGQLAVTDVDTTWTPSLNPFAPGVLTVSWTVANEGNVRLGSTSQAQVSGPFGWGGASASDSRREVLPDQASTARTTIPVWGLFRTTGDVTAVPVVVGDDVLDVELAGGAAEIAAWTVPWTQLALLALVVALALAVRALRRRSGARLEARIEAAVAERTRAAAPEEP